MDAAPHGKPTKENTPRRSRRQMQAFREKTEKGIRKAKNSYVGHADTNE